jgi:anthranilate synthase/aminodeoxychorismate synthase-like glutamine amidotransferase
MKVLLIDNYDSFVYNIYQYLLETGCRTVVKRNDEIGIEDVKKLSPDFIFLSPGPGHPKNAGICINLIKEFYKSIPIFGICLGHQAIAYAFGVEIKKAKNVVHGKICEIYHDGKGIYTNIDSPFYATRYHSLIIDEANLPEIFEISAFTKDGEIMGIRMRNFKVEGVQFHPESFGTKSGKKLIENFLEV